MTRSIRKFTEDDLNKAVERAHEVRQNMAKILYGNNPIGELNADALDFSLDNIGKKYKISHHNTIREAYEKKYGERYQLPHSIYIRPYSKKDAARRKPR